MQSVILAKIGTIDRSKEIVSQSSVLESMDTDKIDETASVDYYNQKCISQRNGGSS